MFDEVEELNASFEGVFALAQDEVVVPLRADLADALRADVGPTAGERSRDFDVRGAGVGSVNLAAKVDADAALVEEIWREGRRVREAENVIGSFGAVAGLGL